MGSFGWSRIPGEDGVDGVTWFVAGGVGVRELIVTSSFLPSPPPFLSASLLSFLLHCGATVLF